jgi:HEAT repeat protein
MKKMWAGQAASCITMAWALAILGAAGCATSTTALDLAPAVQEARGYLRQQLLSADNPAVRAEAIEGMQAAPWPQVSRYIEHALSDPHRGVRFAACMALAHLRDPESRTLLQAQLKDSSPAVRAASIFALHRLGDARYTKELAGLLLYSPDQEVRRNVALIFAELGDRNAMSVLRRAVRDNDIAVRWHVHEAMARLGDKEAMERLILFAHSGYGDERLIGIMALGRIGDRQAVTCLRDMLRRDNPPEVKLAAVRALGQIGMPDGADFALKALTWTPDKQSTEGGVEPQEIRQVRIRTMAAMALAEAGTPEVVGNLLAVMRRDDPKVAVACAAAILRIAARSGNLAPAAPAEPADLPDRPGAVATAQPASVSLPEDPVEAARMLETVNSGQE